MPLKFGWPAIRAGGRPGACAGAGAGAALNRVVISGPATTPITPAMIPTATRETAYPPRIVTPPSHANHRSISFAPPPCGEVEIAQAKPGDFGWGQFHEVLPTRDFPNSKSAFPDGARPQTPPGGETKPDKSDQPFSLPYCNGS